MKLVPEIVTDVPLGPEVVGVIERPVLTVNGVVAVFFVSDTVIGCDPAATDGTFTVPIHPPVELVLTVPLEIDTVPNLMVGLLFDVKLLNCTNTESPDTPLFGWAARTVAFVTLKNDACVLVPSVAFTARKSPGGDAIVIVLVNAPVIAADVAVVVCDAILIVIK